MVDHRRDAAEALGNGDPAPLEEVVALKNHPAMLGWWNEFAGETQSALATQTYEFIKQRFHRGERRFPYFWRDSSGREIDCLLVEGEEVLPVEIKSGQTMSGGYFNNLRYWLKLAGLPEDGLILLC